MGPLIVTAEFLMGQLEESGEHTHTFKDGNVNLLYSFDNANIHISAIQNGMLAAYDWSEDKDRLALPPYSPDMHRVIEHSHGTGVNAFRRWLYQNPSKNTLQDYKEGLEMCYTKANTADVIARDVGGLKELYDWIYHNNGDMAPKEMR
jgi:hypothetical protein